MSTTGLVPITDAARRCGRSPWTLKRWHSKGKLPVVISDGRWSVPESFLSLLESSPQPGRAGRLEDVAALWFAAHSADPEVMAS